MFVRETISNYEEDQEKQFENDQESAEDTIGNDTILEVATGGLM